MQKELTGRVDYQLKHKISITEIDVKNLEKLAKSYRTEPQQFESLNEKELESRADKIDLNVKKFREL